MNMQHEISDLYSSLVALAKADVARDYLCIRAKNQHGLSSVKVNQLHLGIIVSGEKKVNMQNLKMSLLAGDILIMKADAIIDAVNIPDQHTGEYLTILVPVCEEVIQATQLIWAKPITDKSNDIFKFSIRDFALELSTWQAALFNHDLAQARLCIVGILLKLCQSGHADILVIPAPNLSKKIYQSVMNEPQRDWQSRDIEMQMALSGATLRRKLSAEGTTLRETITHARLAYALSLLYSKNLPLKSIAAKSGYHSVAVFKHRFYQRYGFDPQVLSMN
ncbi:helix-turn-helix domain-containing protein [Acinetobacter populi]|uniref:Transcriptional regulator n=1 Tax=Acinetobacter populi TaxID=1582270 RepID=A0A1Z9Z184_9GAMM|nr:transcriptional regulator [Acinetobacter populi]